MGRSAALPIENLADIRSDVVTPRQLADYLGIPYRTLHRWCQNGWIPGARRRNPFKPHKGDWLIPIDSALQIEARVGFTVKHSAA